MNVSNLSSTGSQYQTTVQSSWKQSAQDFKSLQSALQSGDLSGAQQAFAALQKDQPNPAQATNANSASSQTTATSKDFQALQSALSSGDLSGAQQAFASLKQDIQDAGRAHHGHHHHSSSEATAATPASGMPSAATTSTLNSLLDTQA